MMFEWHDMLQNETQRTLGLDATGKPLSSTKQCTSGISKHRDEQIQVGTGTIKILTLYLNASQVSLQAVLYPVMDTIL